MASKNKSSVAWNIVQEMSIEKLFDLIDSGEKRYSITINKTRYSGGLISTRLQCIRRNHRCVSCGVEGSIVRLEQYKSDGTINGYHFNVYAKVEDCNYPLGYRYVTMTQDHIFPHSLGGSTTLDNLQTMCLDCNHSKDNSIDFSKIPVIGESTRQHIWKTICANNNLTKTFIYFMINPEFNINREAVQSLGVINFSKLQKPEEILKKVFIT